MNKNLNQFLRLSCLVLVSFAIPSLARAERFLCTSVDEDVQIEVHLANDASGASRAEAMIIRNMNVSESRQVVASFAAKDGVLNNNETNILAQVDLSNPNSSRRGERLAGTVLGSLNSILLTVDFSYQKQTPQGPQLSAQVIYTKKSGQKLEQDFDCMHLHGPVSPR